MTTKLFILAGTVLAVLSTVVWAEKKSVSVQTPAVETTVFVPEQEKLEPPLVITKDPKALKGKGFFYAEGGTLYKDEILPDNTLATSSQKVAMGSVRLVDQSDDAVLFVKDVKVGSHSSENELWVLDKVAGSARKISNNTGEAKFSPDGSLIAVSTNELGGKLSVLSREGGGLIAQIGIHGGSPIFSPDGKKIAYIKLKDGPIEMGDPDFFQGVAVYDLVTGVDQLVLKTSEQENSWMIAGWSPNGKKIYFPSSGSTWSVAVDGTGKRQETNKSLGSLYVPNVPMYLSNLLFSDNGKTAFGEGDGLWVFRVGKDGEFLDAKKIAEGGSSQPPTLRWLEKGKSVTLGKIAYKVSDFLKK